MQQYNRKYIKKEENTLTNLTRHRASTEHLLTFRVRTMLSCRDSRGAGKLVTRVHVMLP